MPSTSAAMLRNQDNPLAPLPVLDLLLIFAASLTLFMLWPTPLWSAPRGAGHFARFLVSYLVVVPVAMLALRRRRLLTFNGLVQVVALLWGAKLLATVFLYHLIAPSRRLELHASSSPTTVAAATSEYREVDAASGASIGGYILGAHGAPLSGSVIALCGPSTGKAIERRTIEVAIKPVSTGDSAPELLTIEATVGDRVHIRVAHGHRALLRGVLDGATVISTPLIEHAGQQIPSVETTLVANSPGIIALDLDGRPAGWLLVFTHPYHARTGDAGAYALEDVPEGRQTMCVFDPRDPTRLSPLDPGPIAVRAGTRLQLDIVYDTTEPARAPTH